MSDCCACRHFAVEALHPERGNCPVLCAAVERAFGLRLAGPLPVRSDSPACVAYEADPDWPQPDGEADDDAPPARPFDPHARPPLPGDLVHEA